MHAQPVTSSPERGVVTKICCIRHGLIGILGLAGSSCGPQAQVAVLAGIPAFLLRPKMAASRTTTSLAPAPSQTRLRPRPHLRRHARLATLPPSFSRLPSVCGPLRSASPHGP